MAESRQILFALNSIYSSVCTRSQPGSMARRIRLSARNAAIAGQRSLQSRRRSAHNRNFSLTRDGMEGVAADVVRGQS